MAARAHCERKQGNWRWAQSSASSYWLRSRRLFSILCDFRENKCGYSYQPASPCRGVNHESRTSPRPPQAGQGVGG